MSKWPPAKVGLVIGGIIASVILVFGIWGWVRDNTYPDEYTTSFIANCEASGGAPLQCSCMLSYIKEHYSYKDAVELENRLYAGDTSLLRPILLACQ